MSKDSKKNKQNRRTDTRGLTFPSLETGKRCSWKTAAEDDSNEDFSTLHTNRVRKELLYKRRQWSIPLDDYHDSVVKNRHGKRWVTGYDTITEGDTGRTSCGSRKRTINCN